jgi:hypothetical protein
MRFFSLTSKKFLSTISICALILGLAGSLLSVSAVKAADVSKPLALVYYGWNTSTTDQKIVNAHPSILIGNTPAGYWHGNTNSTFFQSQGISVFSYIYAGYDQYSLSQNYTLINAIAAEGTKGVFVDCANPSATSYNTQLCAYAHSKGLLVILNPGMPYINANMYDIADYVVTDEHYQGRSPVAVEAGHLNQTIVLGYGDWTAQQAASYTNAAWAKGFKYSWHDQNYNTLPTWLETYTSLLSSQVGTPVTPVIVTPPTTSTNLITGTVASTPVSTGAANEYALNIKIISSSVTGVSAGLTLWVAASKIDFPNLLTVGSAISASLDKSTGWWIMKPVASTSSSNMAPILSTIGSKIVTAGQTLTINLSATDPNGDSVSFSVAGSPTGATFTSPRFTWVPTQTGTFSVTFSVSDGKLTDSETVQITVNAAAPPAVTVPTKGNTTGVVASSPISSGSSGEYNLSLKITSTTVSGVTVGQTVWLAAKTSDFPNLLTVGATLSGNLDKSLGWWVLKAAS